MTALFSSGWVGMGIIEDIDRGIMDRFLIAPVRRGALIAGHDLAAVNLLIQSVIIGVMAFLLGAKFEGGLGGFAILRGAAAARRGVRGVLGRDGPVLRQRESVIGVNTMMTLPLTFLSTAFMPLALVPEWIAKVARQPGELGGRGRTGGAHRDARLVLHPAPDGRAADPDPAHDRLGHADLPLVPALHLGRRPGPAAQDGRTTG